MTTERTPEYSGPCPCGQGTLEIVCCSADNGYRVYPDSYETFVVCSACRDTYTIEQVRKAFHLAYKSDVDQISRKKAEFWAEAAKLGVEASQKGIFSAFAQLLDSQKSAAATHRIVAQSGLESSSLATFRKRWRNGTDYMKVNGSGQNVPKILTVLKCDDQRIIAAAANLQTLQQQAYVDPPVINPPFHIAS